MSEDHTAGLDRGWRLWRLAALRSAGLPIERLDVFGGTSRESHRDAFDALLADDLFLAALTWQNPEAVDTWAAAHAKALRAGERPHVKGSRLGHRLAVVTRYAQRYATKNDTIGFFGPVAWARLGGPETGWTGAGGVRRGTVYVEVWAVRAIADAWDADPRLRDHLPVRLDPSCTVRGDTVLRPYRRPYTLTDDEAKALADLPGTSDRASLERLRAAGIVQLGFRVPICSHPLDGLQKQLDGLPDESLRSALVAHLDLVRGACRRIEAATGPDDLRAALAEAASTLDGVAGVPVRRPASGVGGRTPYYLDCRRDLDGTVGDDLLDDLGRPLGVLLDSARWICGQVADLAADHLAEAYRRLAATRDEVTLAELYMAVADLLQPGGSAFAEVVADFQLRWAEIIGAGGAVDVAVARRLADALFPAPRRLWAAARLHSPDLLLRRESDGTLSWVLGELHVALNTLESRFFSEQADDPAEMVAAMAADMAPGRIVPLYPSTARDVSSRSYPPLSLDPPGHYRYVSFGSDDGHPSGVRGTPATAVTVAERDGELIATCRSEGWAAPALECFGENLSSVAVNLFKLRPAADHAPRVTIGAMTVCRESWRVPLEQIAAMPGRDKDPAQEAIRTLLTGIGAPRHVFARVPGDPKPFYVDLAAPLLADNLCRAVRRALTDGRADSGQVELSEMLPAPSELWLRLPDGSYTSELRVVAVDPQPPHPASWPEEA